MWKKYNALMKNLKPCMRTLFKAQREKQTTLRIRAGILAAVLLLTLSLSACGKPEDPAATATPEQLLPTAAPTPVPAVGGEIQIPIPRNPLQSEGGAVTSPLSMNTEEMRNMYSLVYEPLLRCDTANALTPALAEKWSCDESGRVWTLTLRSGVKWHSGDAMLTAEDVLYTISQIKALGAESYYNLTNACVETATKVDDLTVQITMYQPGLTSLYGLLFPVMCAAGNGDLAMNGTGPYKVTSAGASSIILEANAGWWKQSPYITTIRCLSRESNSVALSSYEAGQLNVVPTDTASAGKYRETDVTNVLDVLSQDAEMLLINQNNSQLRNASLRKALAYAIDRGSIVSNVYMNRASITDVPVPPDSFLYDPTSKIYDYDPAMAASLFAEAGYADSNGDGLLESVNNPGRILTFRLLVNDSTESTYRKSAAQMIANQLLSVGVTIEIESEKLTVGDPESPFITKLSGGDFDLALAGFNLPRSGQLTAYLSAGGERNYGHYANSDMNTLLQKAQTAADEATLKEAHAAVQQQFVNDLPFIMLYFRMTSIVYAAEIQGISDVRDTDIFRTVEKWYIHTGITN